MRQAFAILVMSIEWLKRALDETRISQAELAEAMGLSPDKVSKLLNGKRQLKADEMASARAFFAARGRPPVRSFDPDDPDPGNRLRRRRRIISIQIGCPVYL